MRIIIRSILILLLVSSTIFFLYQVRNFIQDISSGTYIGEHELTLNDSLQYSVKLNNINNLQLQLYLDMECPQYEEDFDEHSPLYEYPFYIELKNESGEILYSEEKILSENNINVKHNSTSSFSSSKGFTTLRFFIPLYTLEEVNVSEISVKSFIKKDKKYKSILKNSKLRFKTNYEKLNIVKLIITVFGFAFSVLISIVGIILTFVIKSKKR